jgi:energy-converting hydrogenase Eha subunit A
MKTEITVSRLALIGTIVTAIAGIVVALITHFSPSTPEKPLLQSPPSAAQSNPQPVVQGNQGEVTIINGNSNIKAGGNVSTPTTAR